MGTAYYIKSALTIVTVAGGLFLLFCGTARNNEMISRKVPTILLDFLNTNDPANFAKTHGIKLKDGMVRVVMTVNENFSSKLFISKYNLKDCQKRKNLVTSYVAIDSLKALCEEPSILYIRLPVKFTPMGETPGNTDKTDH